MASAQERFAALVDALVDEPGVTAPGAPGGRGFGSGALKVNGSIFAMISRDRLVVKLPRDRVGALISDGAGGPFDAGKGTPMKEWLTVTADHAMELALAREALAFVGGSGQSRRRASRKQGDPMIPG
jgi:hypothetical protein